MLKRLAWKGLTEEIKNKIIQVLAYAYMYKLKLNQNPLEAELFLLRI
jgi:hypothetical protein